MLLLHRKRDRSQVRRRDLNISHARNSRTTLTDFRRYSRSFFRVAKRHRFSRASRRFSLAQARVRARPLIYGGIVPSIYRPKNRAAPSTRRTANGKPIMRRHSSCPGRRIHPSWTPRTNPPLLLVVFPSRKHNPPPYLEDRRRVMQLSRILKFT